MDGHSEQDITWLRPDGEEMTPEEWNQGWVRCIGLQLNGRTLDDVNGVGEPIRDETFLILLNPHHEPIRFLHAAHARHGLAGYAGFRIPEARPGNGGRRPGEPYELIARSTALLRELTD